MIPFLTLLHRELARFSKVIVQTVVTPLISSFLYLLIFGVSLGSQVPDYQNQSYLAFLIPGLMMMGLMNNAFQNSSSSVISAKFSGDLEDLRVAPMTHQQILWAMSIGGLVRGSLVALISFAAGNFFYFHEKGSWLLIQHPFYLLFFMVVAGLVFSLIGITVAFMTKSFDQLSAFSAFILLPLTYLGGVFISITHLSEFWRTVSLFNPLLYLINGMRFGILGHCDVDIITAVVVSLVGLVCFYFSALLSIQRGSFQRW